MEMSARDENPWGSFEVTWHSTPCGVRTDLSDDYFPFFGV
jgi:hypothetical protein